MKVTITLTVDVDKPTWEVEYGNAATVGELRADVRQYILTGVQDCAAAESGAITSVALR